MVTIPLLIETKLTTFIVISPRVPTFVIILTINLKFAILHIASFDQILVMNKTLICLFNILILV